MGIEDQDVAWPTKDDDFVRVSRFWLRESAGDGGCTTVGPRYEASRAVLAGELVEHPHQRQRIDVVHAAGWPIGVQTLRPAPEPWVSAVDADIELPECVGEQPRDPRVVSECKPPFDVRCRRADARRHQERILDAAIERLGQDPRASVGDIAADAGVGRVTLYGHFPSRKELVEAAFVRVLDRGDLVLEEMDLTGDTRQALDRLIEASWLLTAQAGGLLEAARDVLTPLRVRELHDKPAARVVGLIERGQRAGELRSDIPAERMASALHHLMKGAADDASRGVIEPAAVPRLIAALVLPAFSRA